MFYNEGFGVKQILWSIHLYVGLFQTPQFIVGVQGSFHRTEIQIWLAEVASMGST